MSNQLFGLNQLRLVLHSYSNIKVALCLLLLSSCATTRIHNNGPCASFVQPGTRGLILWLPEDETALLYKAICKSFAQQDATVDYAPQEEWKLRSAGVSNPLDTVTFDRLKGMGYTHFLLIRSLGDRAERSIAYYSPSELTWEKVMYANKPSWFQQGNEAEVLLQWIPIDDIKGLHQVIVKTNIGHLIWRHKDQGETYINASSVAMARNKAIKKGIKRIISDCSRKY